MGTIDKNKSGELDYSEFVMSAISRKNMLSKDRLETAFKLFDRDNSGTISLDEIKEVFGNNLNIDEKVW
jgi:calcium-dependent protein kinase